LTVIIVALFMALQIEVRIHSVHCLQDKCGIVWNLWQDDPMADRLGEMAWDVRVWQVWAQHKPIPPETWHTWKDRQEHRTECQPDAYRVLTAGICKLISLTPYPRKAYALARIVVLWAFFVLLFHLCLLWLKPLGAFACIVVVGLLANSFYMEVPLRTAIHALLMVICLRALFTGKLWHLLVAFVFAALNREDALLITALAGMLWLYDRRDKKWLYAAVGTAGIFLAYRAFAFCAIGYRPYYCAIFQLNHNIIELRYLVGSLDFYTALFTSPAILLVLVLAAYWPTRGRPRALKASLWIFALYILSNCLIAVFFETHRWLPVLAFVVPAAIWNVFPQARNDSEEESRTGLERPVDDS